ncbi:MAG: hypothetical protein WC725_05250 [Patescibacteria group bacterium]|jgi:hypothetical protein
MEINKQDTSGFIKKGEFKYITFKEFLINEKLFNETEYSKLTKKEIDDIYAKRQMEFFDYARLQDAHMLAPEYGHNKFKNTLTFEMFCSDFGLLSGEDFNVKNNFKKADEMWDLHKDDFLKFCEDYNLDFVEYVKH